MHIITVCPRCNEDFMYHASDSHLFRDEAGQWNFPRPKMYSEEEEEEEEVLEIMEDFFNEDEQIVPNFVEEKVVIRILTEE